ncbi:dehydrogenase [Streptomyces filipinensis]|uniref:Dehydrogenase n=1 Tax=Streptomyces filipinensis TaxID=66887 RepID=A0A918MC30_9ACTN|nr:SagB/ThcOx family dehydrogenase [Streptomyces filipinensis]GGU96517.1 dehydrogenase [Streptomyces filipinensis]
MRHRRARGLVCYWYDSQFIVHPYPHGTVTAVHPAAAEVLAAYEDWATPKEAGKDLAHLSLDTIEDAVSVLTEAGALVCEDTPRAARDEEIDRHWGAWAPEAAFLHYASQDIYDDGVVETDHDASVLVEAQEPALFTEYPNAARVLLPRPGSQPELDTPYRHVLYGRRTHRDFTAEPVAVETLATLLATCFGPVDFIDSGRSALYRRTSPQGGSRQELDTYLGVLKVSGLEAGWYHYNGLQHSLELLSKGLTPEEASALCAGQEWAGEAAFLVVLAARLERMSCKYATPRAYRVSLLNAGHLGQTFALTATALGLGPFQTGAFCDTPLAERCTLNNTSHTPLYVLAAGHPSPQPQQAPHRATAATFTSTRIRPGAEG